MSRFPVGCAALLAVTVAGCKTFTGGDGSSIGHAVVIHGSSDAQVTLAEYPWLREHYPGSKLKGQALLHQRGRTYDAMTIVTAGGEEVTVFFDISSGYGRWD